MKTITIADIRSWHPCYDPSRHLPEGWSGTALDLLRCEQIPPTDRLWAVLREEALDDTELRLLACAYVRETPLDDGRMVWNLLTDHRSRAAVEVAERYARGEATNDELFAAYEAANNIQPGVSSPSSYAADAAAPAAYWHADVAAFHSSAQSADSAAICYPTPSGAKRAYLSAIAAQVAITIRILEEMRNAKANAQD
jgi:hypothetical protein